MQFCFLGIAMILPGFPYAPARSRAGVGGLHAGSTLLTDREGRDLWQWSGPHAEITMNRTTPGIVKGHVVRSEIFRGAVTL